MSLLVVTLKKGGGKNPFFGFMTDLYLPVVAGSNFLHRDQGTGNVTILISLSFVLLVEYNSIFKSFLSYFLDFYNIRFSSLLPTTDRQQEIRKACCQSG